jgi:hypothetical protein
VRLHGIQQLVIPAVARKSHLLDLCRHVGTNAMLLRDALRQHSGELRLPLRDEPQGASHDLHDGLGAKLRDGAHVFADTLAFDLPQSQQDDGVAFVSLFHCYCTVREKNNTTPVSYMYTIARVSEE